MCLKQTQHILDATAMTVGQGHLLQKSIAKSFEMRILNARDQVITVYLCQYSTKKNVHYCL